MISRGFALLLVTVSAGCSTGSAVGDPTTPDALVRGAAATVTELRADNEALDYFLSRAEGVIVLPGIWNGGLVIGLMRGSGVVSLRSPSGAWSEPGFIQVNGVSFGAQAGLEKGQIVVVLMNQRLLKLLDGGALDFGAGASLSLGPGDLTAASSLQTFDDAYVFRDKAGVYAGLVLDSAVVRRSGSLEKAYREGPPSAGALKAALSRPGKP